MGRDGRTDDEPDVDAAAQQVVGELRDAVGVAAYDLAAGKFTIVRGQRGESATTFTSSASLWWMPVTVEILYGWTAAPTRWAA